MAIKENQENCPQTYYEKRMEKAAFQISGNLFFRFFYLLLAWYGLFLSTLGNIFIRILPYTANKAKSNKIFSTFFPRFWKKNSKNNFLKKSLSMSSEVSLVFTYLFYDPVTHILWHGKAGKWTKGKKTEKLKEKTGYLFYSRIIIPSWNRSNKRICLQS